MKPRYEEMTKDARNMLEKAERLLEKAEKLRMVEHKGKKVPHFAADGKGANDHHNKDSQKKADMAEKDKYCMKNFGKKYSECSDKQKAQCDKAHGKVEKASYGMDSHDIEFHIETGGQTRNMFYYTNQATLDSTDVTNKGATTSSVNMEGLADRMNTHQTGTQDREVSTDNTQPDRD